MLKFGQIKNNNVSAPEKKYKELHTQQPKLLTMWNWLKILHKIEKLNSLELIKKENTKIKWYQRFSNLFLLIILSFFFNNEIRNSISLHSGSLKLPTTKMCYMKFAEKLYTIKWEKKVFHFMDKMTINKKCNQIQKNKISGIISNFQDPFKIKIE